MEEQTLTAAAIPSEGFLDALPQVFCRFYYADQSVWFDYVSDRITDWTGIAPRRFVSDGINWLTHIHASDRQLLPEAIEAGRHRPEGFSVEYRLSDAGDGVRYIRHTGRMMTDKECSESVWCGCLDDMTAIRQARQDLERSQLLQNMGRMVAGIAHEINTPIQFIGDNLNFLAEAWEAMCLQLRTLKSIVPDEHGGADTRDIEFLLTEAPDAIRQSLEGIDRINTLVTAMRDFSHLDERRMAVANINRSIQSTLILLRNELKYVAEIHTELDVSLPEVYCSIDEISRVLLNLLINAGHSIREKIDKKLLTRGRITIGTRCCGDQVEIVIQDNGMGIPDAIRHRIFDRFFTTKRNTSVHGTGQGLAMARTIIEGRHKGQIDFDSVGGEGTTFYLRLPVNQSTEGPR